MPNSFALSKCCPGGTVLGKLRDDGRAAQKAFQSQGVDMHLVTSVHTFTIFLFSSRFFGRDTIKRPKLFLDIGIFFPWRLKLMLTVDLFQKEIKLPVRK